MEPAIVIPDTSGFHNDHMDEAREKLRGGRYRDFSTVCVTPAIANIPPRVAQSWLNLKKPPNQPFMHILGEGMEVGAAYSHTIEAVLRDEKVGKCRFILTLETDNAPPPQGLIRLLYTLDDHPEFSAVSGLYWTKGEAGVPQVWGHPDHPDDYFPWLPEQGQLAECNAIGMGFALWRTEMFRDERISKPLFETVDSETQDIVFASKASKVGHKFAVDASVLVGHWDDNMRRMW